MPKVQYDRYTYYALAADAHACEMLGTRGRGLLFTKNALLVARKRFIECRLPEPDEPSMNERILELQATIDKLRACNGLLQSELINERKKPWYRKLIDG